ncbi:SixA phosphatase family protein [Neisseriaceae bacterium B1]
MNIILWRHAEAHDGSDDLERELTAKGERQAAKMVAHLRERLPENYELWVSEAKRSQQTAAYLAEPTRMLPEINPESDVRAILDLLMKADESATIVVVGHQPWLGELCAFILNQSWHNQAYWSVKKAAFWWFVAHPSDGILLAKLKWMMTP